MSAARRRVQEEIGGDDSWQIKTQYWERKM
jgi:hypothetical protein